MMTTSPRRNDGTRYRFTYRRNTSPFDRSTVSHQPWAFAEANGADQARPSSSFDRSSTFAREPRVTRRVLGTFRSCSTFVG